MDLQIDLLRLARAVHLDAERTGYGHTYFVRSSEDKRDYLVNLEKDECSCEDRQRGNYCKHILAAQLREGDETVIRRLRWFIPLPRRAKQVA